MARQVRSPLYELTSGAAAVDAVPFRIGGEHCTVQIVDAPANLGRVQGCDDGVNFVNLTFEGAGGVAAINNVGAGLYEVRERPQWIRFGVNIDGAAPRIFRGMFAVHIHD